MNYFVIRKVKNEDFLYDLFCYSINIPLTKKYEDLFINYCDDILSTFRSYVGIYYSGYSKIFSESDSITKRFRSKKNIKVYYRLRIVTENAVVFINSISNKLFANIKQMEQNMGAPYKLWTIASLKDEIKRRYKTDEVKDFDKETDKMVLIEFLEQDDRRRSNKRKEKIKKTKKEKTVNKAIIDKRKKKKVKDKPKNKQSSKTNKKETVMKDKKETAIYRQMREAKKSGDKIQYERLRKRIARQEAREKEMTPERKAKIKVFKKKFSDKEINWNARLKKAGVWESGMQLLNNYDKYLILKNKGKIREKLIKAFRDKRDEAYDATRDVMKKINADGIGNKTSKKKTKSKTTSKKKSKKKSKK